MQRPPRTRSSISRLIAAFLLIAIAIGALPATTSAAVSGDAGLSSVAWVSSTKIARQGTLGVRVKVTNATAKAYTAVIGLRITDPAGKVVFTQQWRNERLDPGAQRIWTADFVAAGTAAGGKYAVRLTISTGSTVVHRNSPAATFAVAATTTPVPNTYWGAWIDGAPWDMSKVNAFSSSSGKGAGIVHWGQPWILGGKFQPFYPNDFQRVRDNGAIPMIDWGSWDYTKGPNQPDFQLADIISGRYDAHIRSWAEGARNWGKPFFLRFNWEMNGNWQFPWSEQNNGNQPGEYAQAWRHVRDIFSQVGATNVSWVWCPNIDYPGGTPLASLYPGDDYVDWVALDGYNWGTDHGNKWQSFADVFSSSYAQLAQIAPSKPIMLGEVASSEDGGSKAEWVKDALGTQIPKHFPWIKAVVWFNWNAGDAALEWPVESSSASVNATKAVVSSPHYIGNTLSTIAASPIPKP